MIQFNFNGMKFGKEGKRRAILRLQCSALLETHYHQLWFSVLGQGIKDIGEYFPRTNVPTLAHRWFTTSECEWVCHAVDLDFDFVRKILKEENILVPHGTICSKYL